MARPKDIAGNKIRRGDYLVRTVPYVGVSPLYKFLSYGKYIKQKELDVNPIFKYAAKTRDYVKVVELISYGEDYIPTWMMPGNISPANYVSIGVTGMLKVPKNLCEPTVNVESIKMFLVLAGYPLKEEKEDDS